jgi:hypothetical protein
MTRAKKMSRAKKPSSANTPKLSEWALIGALQAARGLRNPAEAKAAQKVWMDLARKQGYDAEKMLRTVEQLEAKQRKEHPERMLPHLREEP